MSKNKATILKAVGSQNEAQATKLVADLDLGLGKLSIFLPISHLAMLLSISWCSPLRYHPPPRPLEALLRLHTLNVSLLFVLITDIILTKTHV